MAPPRVAIAGSSGMLGSTFRTHLAVEEELCLTRADLDVTQPRRLRAKLADLRPELVLNCAADTDVEGAERETSRAFAANAVVPALLAQACRDLDITLVHFSSTGCYGIQKSTPYDDYDELRPTTVHHRAKAGGEAAVREAGGPHIVMRLGWLYGGEPGHRKNFVMARIREGRSKPEVVSDPFQTGNPTSVEDVVAQTMALVEAGVYGTFNCVAGGSASRFDYVRKIVTAAGLDTRLLPQRFARAAQVSPNEAAVNMKLDLLGLNRMPLWDDALVRYVERLLRSET